LGVDPTSFVPAYHWACAIDDFDGEFQILVRAWDLAESTPIQREIIFWVAELEKVSRPVPAVFHTSLITQNDGHRLEKRTLGVTLSELREAGFTIEKILSLFDASFSKDFQIPSAGQTTGESLRERTLANLGF
jgi:glutamyl/glutaminyl-tRNA synthetase